MCEPNQMMLANTYLGTMAIMKLSGQVYYSCKHQDQGRI
jgi:hypothetical protein